MIAVSPDGANVVYVANQQLYIRTMAELKSHPIQGTALDVDTPFFSPDSSWIAFHSSTENKFKKIAITGGAPITICDSQLPFGASWAPDNSSLLELAPRAFSVSLKRRQTGNCGCCEGRRVGSRASTSSQW